jgi:LPXTG-motif cell wall-anchored protein
MYIMRRYLALGILALAACLAPFQASAHVNAQAVQEINVTLSEFAFTPSTFTVMQGQPVHITVTNTGKFPHNVAFQYENTNLKVFAANIPGGGTGSADFTFTDSGTWRMYCPVDSHADRGMVGQVIVMAAAAPGMPTTGQPGTDTLSWLGLLSLILLGGGFIIRRRGAAQRA